MKYTEQELKEIEISLNQFTGTEKYYKHFTGILYTDGINYFINKLNCYWFLDIIGSYQHKFKNIGFQVWGIKLFDKPINNKVGYVYMKEDTEKPLLVKQELSYTDFKLKEYEIYFINGVVLLKSEY